MGPADDSKRPLQEKNSSGTKEEEFQPDWEEEADPNMRELKDGDDSDDEDALGETIEPIAKEKQECENSSRNDCTVLECMLHKSKRRFLQKRSK